MQIAITAERIRGIGSNVLHDQMSTTKAEAFLALYSEALEAHMLNALTTFVQQKLG